MDSFHERQTNVEAGAMKDLITRIWVVMLFVFMLAVAAALMGRWGRNHERDDSLQIKSPAMQDLELRSLLCKGLRVFAP